MKRRPMPTEEQRRAARMADINRLLDSKPTEPARAPTYRVVRINVPGEKWPRYERVPPVPTGWLEALEAAWRAQWERERAARVRAGACPMCGERRCPRVGGKDEECVPLLG